MKKLRKRLMSWLMVVAMTISTFAPFMPMTVHAASEYDATIDDVDIGTVVEGFNQTDFYKNVKLTNTGTEPLVGGVGYMKIELTSGDTDAFGCDFRDSGYIPSTYRVDKASVYPKNGLTAGTYTATLTLSYDRDGDETAYSWEVLDTATVTVKVNAPTISHNIIVENGTSDKSTASEGETVYLTAEPVNGNMAFSEWEVISGGITIINKDSFSTARFTMPNNEVRIRAKYVNLNYSATIGDVNVGTTGEGFNPNDFRKSVPFTNTGSGALDGGANYMKIEFTSGDIDAFGCDFINTGYILSGGTPNKAYVYPKTGLTAGTYTATLTLSYDRDGNETAYGWEELDTATVTFKVNGSGVTQHTVTFYDGSSVLTELTQQVNDGEKATRPATDPTKTGGYAFVNWFVDASFTTPFDFDTPITTATPIYAKFIKKHTITFDSNGGFGSIASIIVNDGTDFDFPTSSGFTAPSGKEFDKWEVSGYGTFNPGASFQPSGDLIVKAIWKDIVVAPTQYTITFINGIDSSTINTAIVNDGEKVARPTTDPTMANHTFDNWYSDAGMTTPFDFDTPITAHTPIYAKFIPNSVTPQYAATVEDIDFGKEKVGYPDLTSKAKMIQVTNNGTENLNIDDNCITLSGDVDKFDILIAYNTPLISGQTKGINWIKPKNGLGIGTYTVIATFKDKDNKVTATANITFTVTDSSLTEHTITVVDGTSSKTSAEKNETITITADSAPSGKEFDKWVVEEGTITLADVNNSVTTFTMPDEAVKVKATYKDIAVVPTQYTITFINGNDSSTIDTATVNENEKATRPTTDPTMANHTFDNWYSDAGMTIPFDFDTPITAHTPIYAKFIPNSVTPTYVIESGANQTYTIDSNVDVVIKASGAKANLSKIQIDGTDLDTANYNTEEGSTILTLKASYLNTLSEGDHTVKFVYNDGDVSTNLKVVKNTTGGNTGGNTDPSNPTDPSGTNTGGNTGTNTNNNTSSPQTSDNIVFYIMTMLLSLFGIAGASVYVNRKKLFNR